LSKNEFKTFPKQALNLTNLKELNLKLNSIKLWPKELSKMTNLEKLDLSFNNLEKIEAKKKGNGNLKSMNLSFNKFQKFPEKILLFDELEEINLGHNDIADSIPEGILKFQDKLKILELEKTNLTKFPTSILQLYALKSLNLNENPIKELPSQDLMFQLSSLETLSLSKCELKQWANINHQVKLKTLNLSENQIVSIPYEVKSLCCLKELKLNKNLIKNIPDHFQFFDDLETLDLSQNKIDSIDHSIGRLKNLKTLLLNGNNLTLLPIEFGDLINLEYLDLSDNKLFHLFPFDKMLKLTSLTCKSNRIKEIPNSIGNATSLTQMDFTTNCIKTLPKEIYHLKNLVFMRLKHNQIEFLDSNLISNLSCLSYLNLDNNAILELPDEIMNCLNLKNILLSFNNPNGIKMSEKVSEWIKTNKIEFTQEFEVCTKVLDSGLYIGSANAATNKHHLKELNVTHVLTIASNIPPPHLDDIKYLIIYAEDARTTSLIKHFDDTGMFIRDALEKGEGVIVHCMAGVSRSATVTIAYLMKEEKKTLKEAFNWLKKKRPIIDPNPTFKKELKIYQGYLLNNKFMEEDESLMAQPKNKWKVFGFQKDDELFKICEKDKAEKLVNNFLKF
jgi:Leucine-rich repeat (LRR) protein/protein-tyrosine phosphatase